MSRVHHLAYAEETLPGYCYIRMRSSDRCHLLLMRAARLEAWPTVTRWSAGRHPANEAFTECMQRSPGDDQQDRPLAVQLGRAGAVSVSSVAVVPAEPVVYGAGMRGREVRRDSLPPRAPPAAGVSDVCPVQPFSGCVRPQGGKALVEFSCPGVEVYELAVEANEGSRAAGGEGQRTGDKVGVVPEPQCGGRAGRDLQALRIR